MISYFVVFVAVIITAYYFWPMQKLPAGTHIDSLVVLKSERRLLAYSNGKLMKTYTISLGKSPIGHKVFEGDMKTPEGLYTINAKNPNSGYHKNLGVSYPNDLDRAIAARIGKSPGGDIKIHGIRNGRGYIGKFHRWADWTHGCIAVTDEEIDELYNVVGIGATIQIKP